MYFLIFVDAVTSRCLNGQTLVRASLFSACLLTISSREGSRIWREGRREQENESERVRARGLSGVSSYKATDHSGSRLHFHDLNYLHKDLTSKYSTLGVGASTCEFGRREAGKTNT